MESIFGKVAVFTDEIAKVVEDPLAEVARLIELDGLNSGDRYRVSTYSEADGKLLECKVLLMVEVP